MSQTRSERDAGHPANDAIDIAIVGGGISGLYCARQLSRLIAEGGRVLHLGGTPLDVASLDATPIHLFEASPAFGGRIETWTIELRPGDPFRAEFGPMRIEPRDQPLLKDLLDDLGIREPQSAAESPYDLTGFSPYAAEEPIEPKFTLTGEEAEQRSLLDLLLLAIRRICELVAEEGQRIPNHTDGDAARYWRQFLAGGSVRRHYWKSELRDWILSLDHADYDHIRRNISINGVCLRDMGFWNLLSEVLSHLAVLRIRDWGSYYHLLSENPNAAEHLIMWLRGIKSTNSLRGIRGGMQLITSELQQRLAADPRIALHTQAAVTSLEPVTAEGVRRVRLGFADGRSVLARDVVLALPKRPLERLGLSRVQPQLDAVVGIPLLKVFFVIDQPWWEDDRPANRFAADLPTREIHYWKSRDRSKGVIMIYMDRPALQFWTDYLPPDEELRQDRAATWRLPGDERDEDGEGARRSRRTAEERLPNRRLWKRFVQYCRDYEHDDFTADRLLAVGIRDWGKEPYGGAVHVWRPRQRSWEVMQALTAFSLDEGASNVHVIGDAYSDYQGFIEGALRSTGRLLEYYVRGQASTEFDDYTFLDRFALRTRRR